MGAMLADEPQTTMFDLSGKEFNAYWVDEKAPLFVPNNPTHWKAHKLQIMVARLEKQSQNNPAQFNSKNYIDALNELERLLNDIRKANEVLDEGAMAGVGNAGTTAQNSEVEPISMDS